MATSSRGLGLGAYTRARGRVIDGCMTRFKGRIESARGGGHLVAIPDRAAKAAKLAYRMRVRGTLAGTDYRSSLMPSDGSFCLGVHKATLAKAGVAIGDTVTI